MQKSVSGRVDYIVAGMEAGPSKMKKAEDLKLKVIDEDGLFNLIRTLPEKPFEDMGTSPSLLLVLVNHAVSELLPLPSCPARQSHA